MLMAMAISATTSLFAASGKCVTTNKTRHLRGFKSLLFSLQQQTNLIYLLCSDELTPRRMAMVNKAFNMMDNDGSGQLTISDIAGIYDVSMNPEFLEGRKTRDEIL